MKSESVNPFSELRVTGSCTLSICAVMLAYSDIGNSDTANGIIIISLRLDLHSPRRVVEMKSLPDQ